MGTAFENRHKIISGCSHHDIFPFDEKFYCALSPESAFDNFFCGGAYLFNEASQLGTMCSIRRVKTEINRMFTNFATQLLF